jgi:hypothetical protein
MLFILAAIGFVVSSQPLDPQITVDGKMVDSSTVKVSWSDPKLMTPTFVPKTKDIQIQALIRPTLNGAVCSHREGDKIVIESCEKPVAFTSNLL